MMADAQKARPFSLFFLLFSLLHLGALLLESRWMLVLTKPLLVSSLAVFFFWQTRLWDSRFRRLMLAGLILSVAGDSFLMFSGTLFFLLGLSSFLLAHIAYLNAFLSVVSLRNGWLNGRWWVLLFFGAYLVVLLSLLWPGLDPALRGPVVLYGAAISLMSLSCLNLKGQMPKAIFQRLWVGALLFMASDSILAIDRFGGDRLALPYPSIMIMSTYLAAQYLLSFGALAFLKKAPAGENLS